jgi:hypothetical protein
VPLRARPAVPERRRTVRVLVADADRRDRRLGGLRRPRRGRRSGPRGRGPRGNAGLHQHRRRVRGRAGPRR